MIINATPALGHTYSAAICLGEIAMNVVEKDAANVTAKELRLRSAAVVIARPANKKTRRLNRVILSFC